MNTFSHLPFSPLEKGGKVHLPVTELNVNQYTTGTVTVMIAPGRYECKKDVEFAFFSVEALVLLTGSGITGSVPDPAFLGGSGRGALPLRVFGCSGPPAELFVAGAFGAVVAGTVDHDGADQAGIQNARADAFIDAL